MAIQRQTRQKSDFRDANQSLPDPKPKDFTDFESLKANFISKHPEIKPELIFHQNSYLKPKFLIIILKKQTNLTQF